LPLARDHKRLRDGDAGPNTGGMGAYSPLPDLPDDEVELLLDAFHRPLLAELARRGTPFRGALYGGLMLTADGPVLLECNARFGDPETQAILPRLAVALGPWLLAAARGELAAAMATSHVPGSRLPTLPGAAVALVLAAAGYPDRPRTGDAINGLAEAAAAGALIFHAGTTHDADGTVRTAGGRVLSVVGRGADLAAARDAATAAADRIVAPGLQRRHDIARELVGSSAGAGR
jgi:phosphoribosylamine--glycine ligase